MSALRRVALVPRRTAYSPRLLSQTTTRSFARSAANMVVHHLKTKADWDAAVAQIDSVLVLDAFAEWCGPCKMIAPQVAKFSDTHTDARFYKLDVDEVPEVAQELGIRAMPTFLIYKGGKLFKEVVGANPKALEAAIEEAKK